MLSTSLDDFRQGPGSLHLADSGLWSLGFGVWGSVVRVLGRVSGNLLARYLSSVWRGWFEQYCVDHQVELTH